VRATPFKGGELVIVGGESHKTGIVKVDGDRVAAFRDDDGVVHAVSPICTHLYCQVGFNAAERSWDCPCQGSRFATDGAVIEGPAVNPLERKEL
jgi:Rieske Fe-S protein